MAGSHNTGLFTHVKTSLHEGRRAGWDISRGVNRGVFVVRAMVVKNSQVDEVSVIPTRGQRTHPYEH